MAATFEPGASASVVARRYNLNANQVFSWRRRYGQASRSLDMPPSSSGLVPVTITPGADDEFVAPSAPAVSDTIEIEVPDGSRVRVGSGFYGRTLKRVLDALRKR